jgi:hypothetical protein
VASSVRVARDAANGGRMQSRQPEELGELYQYRRAPAAANRHRHLDARSRS